MKTNRLALLALALALPASSLLAQNDGPPQGGPPDGPPPGGRRHHPPMPLIMALDTNHDGIISADEIANASAALKTLDKNGDGQLTPDEYAPPRPQRDGTNAPPPGSAPAGAQDGQGQNRPHRPPPPIVAALDTNGDGIISADEIANASASLLKLDKNGDGQLTMDELMPPRPPRDGDGPGDGQGPPRDSDGQGGPGNGRRPPPPDQNN